ncbi:hypothetical protein GCM10020256_71200 [Streptomyces thermocoprophilus]
MPLGVPVGGRDQAFPFDGGGETVEAALFEDAQDAVPVAGAEVGPFGGARSDVGVGAGGEDVVQMAARRCERRIGGRGPGDQQGGSLIRRPARVSSSNVECQAAPKERVWWARRLQVRSVPACRTTADGACRSGSGRRGAAAEEPVDGGQVGCEDDGVAGGCGRGR